MNHDHSSTVPEVGMFADANQSSPVEEVSDVTGRTLSPLSIACQQESGNYEYRVFFPQNSYYPNESLITFPIPSTEKFKIKVYEGDTDNSSKRRRIILLDINSIPTDIIVADPVAIVLQIDQHGFLLIELQYPTSTIQRE